jgi:TusA-related sulfurtransferase
LEILDVRGEICPVPLVETVRKLKTMKNGEVLKVLSDHPPAKKSIPFEMEAQEKRFELVENGPDFEIIIYVG